MTSFYHHQQQHDVFHEGEKLVQRRAGTARSAAQLGASMIEALLPPDAPLMLAAAPYLALTSLHNRRPWTSLLFGPPGFVRATDLETIVLQVAADAADPFLHNARAALRTDVDVDVDPTAAFVGMLCIDFVTRDRLRINAQVVAVEEPQGATVNVVLQVREVFGNCPKYIQARELPLPPPRVLSTHVVDQGSSGRGSSQTVPASLSHDQIALVRKADTFFLGTLHPNRGADCSHRGGRPGFVRVEDATHVWWPDYSGNGMFQSLGNLQINSSASVAIPSFASNRVLLLSGQATVMWLDDTHRWHDQTTVDGASRIVSFAIEEIKDLAFGAPLDFLEPADMASPYNPKLTGPGLEAANGTNAASLTLTCAQVIQESEDVKTFVFRLDSLPAAASLADQQLARRLLCYQPGEYGAFELANPGNAAAVWSRTWTLSSAPPALTAVGTAEDSPLVVSISVKSGPHSQASRYLHEQMGVGHTIKLVGVEGGGNMSFFMSWPAQTLQRLLPSRSSLGANELAVVLNNVVYKTIVVLTAGIGITPLLANLRSLALLKRQAEAQGLAGKFPRITLLHAHRAPNAIPFFSELLSYVGTGLVSKLEMVISGEEPVPDINLAGTSVVRGRLTKDMVDRALPADRIVSVFLCGPTGFMASMRQALTELNLPVGFIHQESFVF